MVTVLGIILFILLVSLIAFFLAFYNRNNKDITYNVMTGPGRDEYRDVMIATIKKAAEIPYEAVYIKSRDGLKLFGRLYVSNPGAPVHIQFHGYRDNGIKDFSGGLQIVLKNGWNAIVVDQRAHGKSEGHIISFGIKERYDVLCWIDYARKKFGADTPIFIDGISMGAATVLMASNLELSDNVRGIIADCPYSDPFDIIKKVAADHMPCSAVLNPFIVLASFLFGHFNIFESSAVKSVAETKIPVLLIHGTADSFVPIEMSRKIYEANREKVTKIEVEGAQHGLSYLVNKELYETEFASFVKRLI